MGEAADDLMFREIGSKPEDGKVFTCGYCGANLGTSEKEAQDHVNKCNLGKESTYWRDAKPQDLLVFEVGDIE